MRTAVIVDAVRTPIGKRNGVLRNWHPVELVAALLESITDRTGLDPAEVDDVILGCVMQVGEQAVNVARNAVLAAGWPEQVPGTTVDRQCGSGQQAIQFAAQAVMAGTHDVVIAGGVEAMTRVPMGSTMVDGKFGYPYGPSVSARYSDQGGIIPQGISAELVAEQWSLSRRELDEFGVRSQRLAVAAADAGKFDREIVPIKGRNGQMIDRDEGIRPTELADIERLPPAFRHDGIVTAGNTSQISDGAAVSLIMSEQKAAELGLRPRARLVDFVVAGDSPRLMLTATMPATKRILERNGLAMSDLDLIEINEAFASAVLAWVEECKPDLDRVNVNGGAIALGHPLGCSGARMLATLLHELERRGGGLALQAICEGGGMANAMLLETV